MKNRSKTFSELFSLSPQQARMTFKVEREHATHLEDPNWTSVKSIYTRMLCVLVLLSGDDGTHDFSVDIRHVAAAHSNASHSSDGAASIL